MSLDSDKKILILIPALNPPKEFINYIELLIENNFKNILVVNDGSEKSYDEIFEKIQLKKECTILKHEVNEGKGKAIKDGLNYFKNLENIDDFIGVITVDCDGQHLVKDILNVSKKMFEEENSLLLGTRKFDENVPLKSSFGNKATSNVFKILYGIQISDTQTGLRGIPKSLIEDFLNLNGNRYEYEMNMLIECVLKNIKIIEIPIETVYIDSNSNTHFRPIKDSLSIYWRIFNSFIKYSAISLISCIIDVVLFKIFLIVVKLNLKETVIIMLATIFARIISSFVNFILNKKIAFDSKKRVSNTIVKYYCLCICQMIISGFAVSVIYSTTHFSEVIIKLIVDTILFCINYRIQRKFIFNE